MNWSEFILAFLIGFVIGGYLVFKFSIRGWNHARHCYDCKQMLLDDLSKHDDSIAGDCPFRFHGWKRRGTPT